MAEILLLISIIVCIALIKIVSSKGSTNTTSDSMALLFTMLIIWCSGLLAQRLCIKFNLNINAIYLDYITYIGICFSSPVALIMSIKYLGKPVAKKLKLIISIVPILSLLVLWTNDFHNLFYETYAINFNETVYGPMFYINAVYSYILMATFVIIMVISSIRKSGFFSIQTGLIVLGSIVPLLINVLGTLRIINISIYVTPISFVITFICYAIAIIKFKVLNIIPVAFKTIIDTMSDSFVVVSEDGTIADLNKTFIEKFKPLRNIEDRENLFEILKDSKAIDIKQIKSDIQEAKDNGKTITKEYHVVKEGFDKYFEVDFQPIKAKDETEFIATLLLLRDITTAKKDMEIMMKNEGLVLLGELAGGVAHDINTPISAIKSGLLMMKSLVKTEDEKMLVERMDSCANKIVALTNSLRNQIRNLGSDEIMDVHVTTVVKDIQVITHSELMKNNVQIKLEINKNLIVKGNSTKLSQVITNLVVNSSQAYEGKGGIIEIVVDEKDDNAIITVEDWAGGIPESIRPYIFKNILTTKGVSGTGFGLYLAYSVVKGAFSGEIYFETKTGKGTKFFIVIPKEQQAKK